MRNKPSLLDLFDRYLDRFMEVIEMILPLWAIIILASMIYQMVTR